MSALPPVRYTRDLDAPDESRQQLARAAVAGRAVRLARGAYVSSESFMDLSDRDKYAIRIRAVAETRGFRPVLSHWSAAAIHRLPILGEWPAAVHVTVGRTAGGRSRNGVVKHSLVLGDADVVEIDGLLVTSIERTVIDLAAILPFMGSVMVADRALLVDRFGRIPSMTSKEDLLCTWESMRPFRAFARTRAVVEFAETRAESPLESVSRVTMRTLGCPEPVLQSPQFDADGLIGETDFAFPEYNAVGEADGMGKYLDLKLRGGRTADEVVVDEKVREDRIRAIPRKFARWRWQHAVSPARLAAKLAAVGVPTGVRR